MELFLSQFVNKVDKKGRVSLPSLFRNALPQVNNTEIILYKSLKYKSIEGCDSKRINEIANRINNLDFFSDDQEDFATSIFSEVIPTKLDNEGRFLLPENLKKYANISEQASFIGQGHYFQIWEPNAAIERQDQSRKRLASEKKTLSTIILNMNDKNAK